jgi:hypothetical protein
MSAILTYLAINTLRRALAQSAFGVLREAASRGICMRPAA